MTIPRRCFFCRSFLLFMFRVCHAFLPGHCSLLVICWERANLLALLYVVFFCVFVTFLCGVLGQMMYLIVSIPDLCLLTYFYNFNICYTYRKNGLCMPYEIIIHKNLHYIFQQGLLPLFIILPLFCIEKMQ